MTLVRFNWSILKSQYPGNNKAKVILAIVHSLWYSVQFIEVGAFMILVQCSFVCVVALHVANW